MPTETILPVQEDNRTDEQRRSDDFKLHRGYAAIMKIVRQVHAKETAETLAAESATLQPAA